MCGSHPLVLDAECLPNEVHLRQRGVVKKVVHESDLDHAMYQHLQDQKKDHELDDSKKDQELDDSKKDHELDESKKNHELDDSKEDKELGALKKDQESDNSEKDRRIDNLVKIWDNYSKSFITFFDIFHDSKKDCYLDDLMEKLRRCSLRCCQMLYLVKKYFSKNELFLGTTECADNSWLPDLRAFLDLKENW